MVSESLPWQGIPSTGLQVYLSWCSSFVETCVKECLEELRVQEGLWREDRAGERCDGEPGP